MPVEVSPPRECLKRQQSRDSCEDRPYQSQGTRLGSEGANNANSGQPLSNGRPLNSQGESIRIKKPMTKVESRQGAISVHSSVNSQKSNTSSQRQVIKLQRPGASVIQGLYETLYYRRQKWCNPEGQTLY